MKGKGAEMTEEQKTERIHALTKLYELLLKKNNCDEAEKVLVVILSLID